MAKKKAKKQNKIKIPKVSKKYLKSRTETPSEIITSSLKKKGKAKEMEIHGNKVKFQKYNFSYKVKRKVEKVQSVTIKVTHFKNGNKSFKMQNKGFNRAELVCMLGIAQNKIYAEMLQDDDVDSKWTFSHPDGSTLTMKPNERKPKPSAKKK